MMKISNTRISCSKSLILIFFLQYVPCYCRRQVRKFISELKQDVLEEEVEGIDINPIFVTDEGRSYEIKFSDDTLRSKFHGPGWNKLVSDYDLRYGDQIKVYLDGADLFTIEIDLRLNETRGGQRPVLKPSAGKLINLKSNLK